MRSGSAVEPGETVCPSCMPETIWCHPVPMITSAIVAKQVTNQHLTHRLSHCIAHIFLPWPTSTALFLALHTMNIHIHGIARFPIASGLSSKVVTGTCPFAGASLPGCRNWGKPLVAFFWYHPREPFQHLTHKIPHTPTVRCGCLHVRLWALRAQSLPSHPHPSLQSSIPVAYATSSAVCVMGMYHCL